jgi:hypothetical protein
MLTVPSMALVQNLEVISDKLHLVKTCIIQTLAQKYVSKLNNCLEILIASYADWNIWRKVLQVHVWISC